MHTRNRCGYYCHASSGWQGRNLLMRGYVVSVIDSITLLVKDSTKYNLQYNPYKPKFVGQFRCLFPTIETFRYHISQEQNTICHNCNKLFVLNKIITINDNREKHLCHNTKMMLKTRDYDDEHTNVRRNKPFF